MKNILKIITKVILLIIGGLLVIIIALAIALWVISPGDADPITDLNGKVPPGSISSIEKIMIGGQEQYLIIRGTDSTKPVMLFLHGGPGFPEFAMVKEYNSAIENDFVMVYWEQRGAGKSFSENIPAESLNITQLISDTRELSEKLAMRFKQDKIYLMGHSWGSFLGILCANQHPELYHAYFGVGQFCNQHEGEKVALDWVKEQANDRNDVEEIKTLSELNVPDPTATGQNWLDYLEVERIYVTKYGGGIMHKTTGMWPSFKMFLFASEYTFGEKLKTMRGMELSMKRMWPEAISMNLANEIDSMQMPVYIFHGIHDRQTPYSVAIDFYEQLKAPEKAFFTFEQSAHSPILEEVDRFNAVVRKSIIVNNQQ